MTAELKISAVLRITAAFVPPKPKVFFKMCEIGAFIDNSNTLFGWVDVPERLATTSIVTELPPGPPVVIPVSQ